MIAQQSKVQCICEEETLCNVSINNAVAYLDKLELFRSNLMYIIRKFKVFVERDDHERNIKFLMNDLCASKGLSHWNEIL